MLTELATTVKTSFLWIVCLGEISLIQGLLACLLTQISGFSGPKKECGMWGNFNILKKKKKNWLNKDAIDSLPASC